MTLHNPTSTLFPYTTLFRSKLVNDYWENLFRAKEQGKKVIWYNGTYIPPFFHSHDVAWVHGEAWSAMLAAKHGEMPAQQAGDRKSTRLNSSHVSISYAVFCL